MEGPISAYFVGFKGGLVMSFIAFSIVFLIIIALMFIMMALKHFCAAIDGATKAKAAAPAAQKAPAAVAEKAVAPAAAPAEDEGALLAVITAAIAASCGATARVVSFAPATNAPKATAWKQVSRIQNTEGF